MANTTTLFAPQIRSVQPAFIYTTNKGKVKIYFSLSDFNKFTDFTHLRVKITDPNRSSGWGSNSMLTSGKEYIETVNPYVEFIEINLKTGGVFEEFTVNQYYHVQLQFVNKKNGSEIESPWSQVSLIRPIPAIKEVLIDLPDTVYELNRISGEIIYEDKSIVESIKHYNIIVEHEGSVVYHSSKIDNTLGTKFATYLYDCYLPDGDDYNFYIEYTTLNDYTAQSEKKKVTLGAKEDSSFLNSVSIASNPALGAVTIVFETNYLKLIEDETEGGLNIGEEYQIDIQRASVDTGYTQWRTVKSFIAEETQNYFKFNDLTIETQNVYKYRFILKTRPPKNLRAIMATAATEIETEVNDIHLLGENKQLSIRFNPNITNFKYVTQESISNTLGGKFPIVRINGDTKYRQFNLSGTLSFWSDYTDLGGESSDSRGENMSQWFGEENCTLLFSLDELFKIYPKEQLKNKKNLISFLEKRYRDIAIRFLTDQKPKLFKGMAEDTMIVYLSNISFTPNRQLSRDIWDFSCTVTEICDVNIENLIKYNLLNNKTTYTLDYFLKMDKGSLTDSDGTEVTEWVSSENLWEENGNYYPLLYTAWKEMQNKGV